MLATDFETLSALLVTMNDRQIGRRFGVTGRTIGNWRRSLCLSPSTLPNIGSQKYQLNRSFFRSIDTPDKAYVLGFIIADGAIHRSGKTVTIAVKPSDVKILESIQRSAGSTAPVHTRLVTQGFDNRPHHLALIHLSSKAIVSDLAHLGVHPAKSSNATFPSIPPHLESHLVRGLFDGDGYIGRRLFELVGSSPLLEGVRECVYRHTDCQLVRRTNNNHPSLFGYRRVRCALLWIYESATLALERKLDSYHRYWA